MYNFDRVDMTRMLKKCRILFRYTDTHTRTIKYCHKLSMYIIQSGIIPT